MRGKWGLSVERLLVTVVVAGLLALVPTGFTALKIASAESSPRLVCDSFAQAPDAPALNGKLLEAAFEDIDADARPLLGRVECTWRNADGGVYWEATVYALDPAAVVGSYGLALVVVAVSWLTRPRTWKQRPQVPPTLR